MFSEVKFINRKNEIAYLSQFLGQNHEKSRIIVISAPSGVGKTSLVNKALKDFGRTPVVNVGVVDHPQFIAEEGEYFDKVVASLADTASRDNRLLSFSAFKTRRTSLSTAKRIAKGTLLHLGKEHLGEEVMDVIADVSTPKSKVNKESDIVVYGMEAFERCPCVIRIENFQKVDRRSIERLKRVFNSCANLVGIFEYTEGATNAVPVDHIQSAFSSTDISFNIYKITKIDPMELGEGLKEFPEILLSALLKHYEIQNGNLRVIVDLQISMATGNSTLVTLPRGIDSVEDIDTTRAVLRALDNPKRFILAMVIAHGAEVDIDILHAATLAMDMATIQAFGIIDVSGIIKSLCSIKYLISSCGKIRTAHDSITKSYISDPASEKFLFISNTVWTSFYRNAIKSEDPFMPRSEALHWLAVLYAAADQTAQLMWVLEQCGHAALQSLAPRRVVALFDQIIQRLARTDNQIPLTRLDGLIEGQAEVLYDANWLDEACECFERANKLSLQARLMYADACIGTNRADIGFAILDELEAIYHSKARFHKAVRIRTGLIRLHGLRTAGRLQECESVFRTLLKAEHDMLETERAFLLRSADVGLFKDADIPQVIRHLEIAITLCRKHGLQADEAAARLALCQHLGYAGKLDEAQAQLVEVEKLADSVWIERYSITNNTAILSILRGDPKDEAIQMLNRSLMLATEDGDRMLILCNLLGAGQAAAVHELDRLVNEIPDLGDELAKIAHYNLSVYYADQKNEMLCQMHRAKAAAMADEPDSSFWQATLRNEPPAREATRLRVAHKYNLVFIVHWRMTSRTFKGIDQEQPQHI